MNHSFPANPSVEAQQDAAWKNLVLAFLSYHPPATMNPWLRNALGDLVQGFFATSQDQTMQGLLNALDARYNVTGLIDGVSLATIRNSAANQATTMPQQQPQLFHPPQPTQPAALQYAFTNAPTMPPAPSLPNLPLPPPPRPPFATQQPTRGRCFPPNLNRSVTIKWRQNDWAYVCDLCGHTHPDRGDFGRHMMIGALRSGFKIVSADPENDRHWYAVDEAGNEYMGDIVACTRNKEKGGKRVQVPHPPPCGPRIVAFERPRRQRARIAAETKANAAKSRKQKNEETGKDKDHREGAQE
ncbi:hypothetical protein A1O7_09040 [Cladophialophora yegresii CBS 114405]|uniref:Uncharacterized protein n=1 Tax=Cladophialophora yegresii CBS 114405 TaxID=1182544 RepID=W9WC56_9EURO|nr:uncharacterized protein A1O7_09040 [Cladophialophora yegresii CBS 114405]EXJ56109.1 hypothetical protein A1O7_09040 [Cladophialophora yegresii CBS 114405]